MINKIAKRVCNSLIKHGTVNSDLEEVYVYGIELLLSFLFSVSLIIAIGFCAGKTIETLVFLIMFIMIRKFTGGFHASTYLKCQICTISSYLIALHISVEFELPIIAKALLIIIGTATVSLIGPIENPNKPIDKESMNRYKTIGTFMFVGFGIIGLLLSYSLPGISNLMIYALTLILLLMLVSFIGRRIKE